MMKLGALSGRFKASDKIIENIGELETVQMLVEAAVVEALRQAERELMSMFKDFEFETSAAMVQSRMQFIRDKYEEKTT